MIPTKMIVITQVFQSLYEYNNVLPLLDADGDGGDIGLDPVVGIMTVDGTVADGFVVGVGMIRDIVGIDESLMLTEVGFTDDDVGKLDAINPTGDGTGAVCNIRNSSVATTVFDDNIIIIIININNVIKIVVIEFTFFIIITFIFSATTKNIWSNLFSCLVIIPLFDCSESTINVSPFLYCEIR